MTDLIITSANAEEVEVHQFAADASELRLPPGQWPRSIRTALGNRQPFDLTSVNRLDGEILSVSYRQAAGCLTLKIFND